MSPLRQSITLLAAMFTALLLALPVQADPVLAKLLPDVVAGDLVEDADAFGPIRGDIAVAPVLKGGAEMGWAFITSDFVSTTGYSGKPIHTLVAVDKDAKVIGVQLVKHSEPIVLIGIPDAKMKALVANYRGMDLVAEANSGGTAHALDIISGATVTVMVIDDLGTCSDAGRQMGHILDPGIGQSAQSIWQSITISAPSAALADALSTSACLAATRAEIETSLAPFPGAVLEVATAAKG